MSFMEESHHCGRCGIILDDGNWYPSARRQNWNICKSCNTKYAREWVSKNKEKRRKQQRVAYARNSTHYREIARRSRLTQKLGAMEILGGARCVNCGCDDLRILEINHKNGGGSKEYKQVKAGHRFHYLIRSRKRSTTDLEVRCRVCNALDYIERIHPELKGRIKVRWD
jgi:hypothetical protein